MTQENNERVKDLRDRAYANSVAAWTLSKKMETERILTHEFWECYNSYNQAMTLLIDVQNLDPQENIEDRIIFDRSVQGLMNMLNFIQNWNFLHEESGMCCREAGNWSIQ